MTRELDEPAGRNHIARLMREHGLLARSPRHFRVTTEFEARASDRLQLAEARVHHGRAQSRVGRRHHHITYVWTAQGWGCLAALLDLFGRRAVGWAFADHMRTELPRKALQRALGARNPAPGSSIIATEAASTRAVSTATSWSNIRSPAA
jgi:transposase InsO family protein